MSREEHPGQLSMSAHPGLQSTQIHVWSEAIIPLCKSLDFCLLLSLLSNIVLDFSSVVWKSHAFPG